MQPELPERFPGQITGQFGVRDFCRQRMGGSEQFECRIDPELLFPGQLRHEFDCVGSQ